MARTGVRALALLAAASLLSSLVLLTVAGTVTAPGAGASPAGSAFTQTKTVTRDHLILGKDSIVDSRNVSVSVDVTKGLRDRQGIAVTWSGARPTGGVIYDNTSPYAANQEYPVAILQCRGVDDPSAPAASRLSPRTCYTPTPELRYQPPFRSPFPAYRLDRYAPAAERTKVVGAPNPFPAACPTGDGAEHWVPFDAADGTSYYGGLTGCAGLAPEQSVLANPLSPASTTFGTTGSDGTGSASFVVQNSEGNASLGCSYTVACSLVVIPIMGISCDASASALPAADRPVDPVAAEKECASTGFYQPGAPGNQGQGDPNSQVAVNGQLWWSASNWSNRISVPITMAQTAAACDITGGGTPENIYGSQYLVQLTQQWAPTFCLDPSLFRLQQVQTSEVQAKNLLGTSVTNGQYLGVKAAFQAGPPPTAFANPIVQAPTAISGFGIVYRIDDAKHHAFTNLKLNARMLAKLMTMSYPAIPAIRDGWAASTVYRAAGSNPLDLSVDPEFLALNPGAKTSTINQLVASSTLFSMSSDSDVMTALTSYINADPDARAWLNGTPDPWGMVVNPHYRKIALPVTQWPLRDDYYDPLNNECIADGKQPTLPLIAGPVSDPSQITFNMQYGISNSQINCVVTGDTDSPATRRLQAEGRQDVGIRFLLGVVGLGDASRYRLDSAALQTHQAANAPVKFTDATGRTFVTPTPASLAAATALLHPDPALHTWTVPYDTLRTAAAGANAYPGTLLMSTDVPTKGLTAQDAGNLAKLLRYAAGPGQVQGPLNGQLPGGYLPMTAANRAGSLLAYTERAAVAVAAQNAEVPSVLGGSTPTPPTSPASNVPPSAVPSAPAPAAAPQAGGPANPPVGAAGAAGAGSSAAAARGQVSDSVVARPGRTLATRPAGMPSNIAPGWASSLVPILAVLGLVSAFASVWLSGVGRR